MSKHQVEEADMRNRLTIVRRIPSWWCCGACGHVNDGSMSNSCSRCGGR